MKAICVIPARYASSRLPGKPLALIGEKPMIWHVYNQALKAQNISKVIIATDHAKIYDTVTNFGGIAIMTDPNLPSGTDRVYAASEDEQADIIINLQGDEPFVNPELLNALVEVFNNPAVDIATPIKQIENGEIIRDPNCVKVIRNKQNFALYFSRAAVPYNREEIKAARYYKHIGIYAYRKNVLKQLTQLQESMLEKSEKLEQLRFLENGYSIYTVETEYDSLGVDTPEDLELVNKIYKKI